MKKLETGALRNLGRFRKSNRVAANIVHSKVLAQEDITDNPDATAIGQVKIKASESTNAGALHIQDVI
jgi:hypothetical protein